MPPWSRDDSLLVLASYLDRPPGMSLPPAPERERVASLVRRTVEAVTQRYQDFAAAERQEPTGKQVARLWAEFGDQPLECAIAADEVMAARRRVPYHLRKRLDQS